MTDRAYKTLEEQIVTLGLRPGAVLSENALMGELGFGRTPIREALQRLERESLVTILPRRGVLVSEVNPQKQLLVLEVRRELERLLARAGALRATPSERARFLEIARAMDAASRNKDDLNFMRLDNALNVLVSQAAHNEYASRAIRLINGLSRRFWYLHHSQTGDLPLCARLHAQFARSIAGGDPAGAARAADKLVDYVEEFTRATVSSNGLTRGTRRKRGTG